MYGIMYQYSYLVEQVEVLLSQFKWNSRDSPTETQLTDRYSHRSTDSLSFVTPANFPRAVTVAWPINVYFDLHHVGGYGGGG